MNLVALALPERTVPLGERLSDLFPPSLYDATIGVLSRSKSTGPTYDFQPWMPTLEYRLPGDFESQATRICDATGWSQRALGRALGVSHPTAGKLLQGAGRHDLGLLTRLDQLNALVIRVSALTRNAVGETDRALRTPVEGRSALQHFTGGNRARAYTTALLAMQPPRASGLIVGSRPAIVGTATTPLDDED